MNKQSIQDPFPIVAIGASAGGLEAISQLLTELPKDTGMGYVFILHLDPKHESMMVSLLSRKTKIPISQAKEGVLVEPDHIYIIPPAKDLTIHNGKLQLTPRALFGGQHMPIDLFMRSLAVDQKNKAIGVVLSGTASDGALGLQSIKAEGGIVIAQDEKSAKYSSMPNAAVAAGGVDIVLPPAKIAQELVRIGKQPYVTVESTKTEADVIDTFSTEETELGKMFLILRTVTGVNFSHYKRSTILRRLQRRMTVVKTNQLHDYVVYLNKHHEEVHCLYTDILITVTRFFRDPRVFEELKKTVFPTLVKDRPRDSAIRIWIAGCSSGEELYSIAILLLEFLEEKGLSFPIQLFGSDISDQEIARARKGIYIENIALDVSSDRLKRFFVKEGNFYRVLKFIRDLCIFARQDLTVDPPFSKIDLITCRNVLIYMEKALQEKIMHMFHFALKPSGFLVLGSSETIGSFTNLYDVYDKKNNIYTAKQTPHRMHIALAARNYETIEEKGVTDEGKNSEKISNKKTRDVAFSVQSESDRLLLTNYTPASVLVDESMEILQFRGHTNSFLEPASGKASFNLLNMAKEGLMLELRSTIHKASKLGVPVTSDEIEVKQSNNTLEIVTLEVIPIKVPTSKEHSYLILFKNVQPNGISSSIDDSTLSKSSTPHKQNASERTLSKLRQELAATKEYLQSLIEDREAANEELKASNEEILSSNEELQSTNEELETAKEELQSINEELNTVNDELQTRNIELGDTLDYAQSIVKTVREPLVVMGGDLRVKSANKAFYKMFNVIPSETEGRLFYELGSGQWDISVLRRYLEEILPQDNQFQDFEVEFTFPKIGHKIMLLNALRLLQKDKKESLILLAIEDITESRVHQQVLKASEDKYRAIFEHSNDAIFIIDTTQNKIIDFNPQAGNMLGYSNEEMVNLPLSTVIPHEMQKLKTFAEKVMQKGNGWANDFTYHTRTGVHLPVEISSSVIEIEGKPYMLAMVRDVTERKKLENHKDEFMGIVSHELKTPVTSLKAFAQVLQSRFQKEGNVKSAEFLAKMDAQINKLTVLIGDLLDVTKIEGGRLQFHEDFFYFDELASEIVEEVQRTTTRHKLIEKGASKKTIHGDKERVGQVITNLLTNAIKYSPHTDKIIITTDSDKAAITFCVKDFGVGISEEKQSQLFERFFRVSGTEEQTYPGLGLGLYISKEIIERQGGRIWVESEKGKGSTFFFSLPINSPKKVRQQKNKLAEEEMKHE